MSAELRVTLLQHTPDPDRAVAIAGRLCYAPVSAADLKHDMGDEDVAKLVRILVRSGHHSALEHASFSFAVDGVSRALTHQLVRHRVASYNQQSQRYVNFGAGDSFIVPPSVAANAEAAGGVSRGHGAGPRGLRQAGRAGPRRGPHARERAGRRALRAPQRRRDQDRRHHERPRAAPLLPVRCCNRAQWEIRALAWEMRGMVKELAPNLFEGSGPGCLYGTCPEGKMTCGKPYKPDDVDGPAAARA